MVVLSYGFYYLVLKLGVARIDHKKSAVISADLPTISIIVPTYNEGKTIGSLLRNHIGLDYPRERFEVIVVDSASKDNTCDVVSEYVKGGLVKLVREDRRSGWNNAVRNGVLHANGQVVVLSGSDVFYEKEAMIRLCEHFADPSTGAVVGRQVLFNADESLATQMERGYRGTQDRLIEWESMLDQPFDVKGEIVAVRKWILEKIIERTKNQAVGVFDICIGFETKAQGMKLVFEPKATYSEYAPPTLRDRLGMQTRRAKLLIESTAFYLWMIWNPRFGKFGTLIFPFHLCMLVFFPWLFLVGFLSLLAAAVSNPFYLMILVLPIVASFSNRGRVLLISFAMAQISLVLAMCTIVTRKNLSIKRIDSTRRIQS